MPTHPADNHHVLTMTQDDSTEDLVITGTDTDNVVRVHYGPAPTWPSPKELEDAVLEAVREVFRKENGTEDPALWEE